MKWMTPSTLSSPPAAAYAIRQPALSGKGESVSKITNLIDDYLHLVQPPMKKHMRQHRADEAMREFESLVGERDNAIDRGDRLEAMVDRMSETIVKLRMALATVKQVYEDEGLTHYKTENGESEINPTYAVIVEALQQKSGLTMRAAGRVAMPARSQRTYPNGR
jgi:hypothetical protein